MKFHPISTKAFTLMELAVVLIILGILAAIAIPIYTDAIEKKKGEMCIQNIEMIIAAEKIYNSKYGTYWPTTSGWQTVSTAQINNALNIHIEETSFDFEVNNAYTIDASNPVHLYATRNGGTYQSKRIYYRYWPYTNTELWDGSWFIDPPGFPTPA